MSMETVAWRFKINSEMDHDEVSQILVVGSNTSLNQQIVQKMREVCSDTLDGEELDTPFSTNCSFRYKNSRVVASASRNISDGYNAVTGVWMSDDRREALQHHFYTFLSELRSAEADVILLAVEDPDKLAEEYIFWYKLMEYMSSAYGVRSARICTVLLTTSETVYIDGSYDCGAHGTEAAFDENGNLDRQAVCVKTVNKSFFELEFSTMERLHAELVLNALKCKLYHGNHFTRKDFEGEAAIIRQRSPDR